MSDDRATETLTVRQRQVLAFIRAQVAECGYPPSIREIGAAVGMSSSNSVAYQLRALERKGFLQRQVDRSRAITITDTAERALGGRSAAEEVLELRRLVFQALRLRMHGERASGWRDRECETWDEWDRAAEAALS